MLIYADICTALDDQSQPRIWLETHALCVILNLVKLGHLEMVHSRLCVQQCLTLARKLVPLSPAIKSRALALETIGVKPLDALYGAAAEAAHCTHLLTWDDPFLKRYFGHLPY